MLSGIHTADLDVSGIRLSQANDALECRCFSRTVGAEQAKDLPIVDLEADALRRKDVVVPFLQILDNYLVHSCPAEYNTTGLPAGSQ
jgi:hypothetical protein